VIVAGYYIEYIVLQITLGCAQCQFKEGKALLMTQRTENKNPSLFILLMITLLEIRQVTWA